MSLITDIIGLNNYEIVRSKIAEILATEFAEQLILNQDAKAAEEAQSVPDESLIELYDLNISSIPSKVFEERFTRPHSDEIQKEPVVNVILDTVPLDDNISGTSQISDTRYVVEVYTGAKQLSVDDPGDRRASLKLQRCLAIIRSILMDPNYRYLSLLNTVTKVNATNIQIAQPDVGIDNADFTIRGKIDCAVRMTETTPDLQGVLFNANSTTYKIYDSGKGYFWRSGQIEIQDLFSTRPELYRGEWVFKNQLNTNVDDYNLVFDLDSITLGIGRCDVTQESETYPFLLTQQLNAIGEYQYEYTNAAVGGQKIAERLLDYSTDIKPLVKSDRKNVYVVFGGINDIAGAGQTYTHEETHTNLLSLISLAKIDFDEVWVLTTPGAPNDDPNINNYNDLIRADMGEADYLIDQYTVLDEDVISDIDCSFDNLHLNVAAIRDIQVPFIYNEIINQSIVSEWSEPNHVQVVNSNMLAFNGTLSNYSITPNISIPDTCYVKRVFSEVGYISGTNSIIGRNSTSGSATRLMVWRTSPTQIAVYVGDGVSSFDRFITDTPTGDIREIEIFVDYINKTLKIVLDDIVKYDDVISGLLETIPSDSAPITDGAFINQAIASRYNTIQYHRLIVNDALDGLGSDIIDLRYNQQNGGSVYDWSGNGNHGTINNFTDNWNYTNDLVEPLSLTKDVSVWANEPDYLIAPIGVGVVESGFTELGDFIQPAGVIEGVINNYLGICYLDWKPNTKTFTELYDEQVNESYIPTKTESTIAKLIIKK